ncbi:hypothetical protein ACFLYK_02265 [Candidatus Cloacimonadota bacterium]
MKKIIVILIIVAALSYVGYTKYKKDQLIGIWTGYDEQQQKYVPVFELRNSGYAAFYSNFFNFNCDELLKDGSFSYKKGKVLTLFFTVRIKNTTYQETNFAERMAYGDNAKRTQHVTIEELQGSNDFIILSLNNKELVLLDSNSFDSSQGSQVDNKFTFKKQK